MPNFCGSLSSSRSNLAISCLASEPRDALADQHVFAVQFHAALRSIGPGLPSLADAHVAGGDADDRALVIVEHFARGKARIDLDAQRLGLLGEPAADIAERHDIVAVIVHQRRHDEIRQPQRAARSEEQELVVL